MREDLHVYFVTYDGIMTLTCGVGTGSRNVVRSMAQVAKLLSGNFRLRFSVVSPRYTKKFDGFREEVESETRVLLREIGGDLLFHDDGTDGSRQFGDRSQWEASSAGAAEAIHRHHSMHGARSIVLATDTPYAGLALALSGLGQDSNRLTTVWTAHSTIRNHRLEDPGQARYKWEQQGIDFIKNNHGYLGYINGFMRDHLITEYGASPNKLIPFKNGLPLHRELPDILSRQAVLDTLGISRDRQYILSCGRAERYKGFVELIRAFNVTQDLHDCDLLLILSDLTKQDPVMKECRDLISKTGTRAVLINNFLDQDVLRRLLSCPQVIAFAGPSLADSGTILPAEIRWWCDDQAPVLLLSSVDASNEAIRDGIDGYLADIRNPRLFGNALVRAVQADENVRSQFSEHGRKFLFDNFDYAKNIAACLLAASPSSDVRG